MTPTETYCALRNADRDSICMAICALLYRTEELLETPDRGYGPVFLHLNEAYIAMYRLCGVQSEQNNDGR